MINQRLSNILQLQHIAVQNPEFRMVLHRLINIQGEDFFQQISRYAGTPSASPRLIEGTEGRIFSVQTGLVGLACRLGKPIILEKDEHFDEIWYKLRLPNRPIGQTVQSLFACPFFAPPLGEDQQYVVSVLYMDSSKEGFFEAPVLEMIYAASRGFVHNLEDMQEHAEISFPSSAYPGYRVSPLPSDLDLVKSYKSIELDNYIFKDFVQDLTFRTISSLSST